MEKFRLNLFTVDCVYDQPVLTGTGSDPSI